MTNNRPEENSDKFSNKEITLILFAISVVIIGAYFTVDWIISEVELQHMKKILGYNHDGYFCRGIDGKTYFPLEDCKDSIDGVGSSVEELEDKNDAINSDV